MSKVDPLSGYSPSWTRFPRAAQIRKIISDAYVGWGQMKGETPPAPFHFTLRVLKEVYDLLQPHLHMAEGSSKWANPESYPIASATPLRALAYFSWESEKRVFLARRVYPTYFDFLTYSQVPESVGVLGLLPGIFLSDPRHPYLLEKDVTTLDGHILFSPEMRRVNYSSVMCVPISDGYDELLGAVVFFFKNGEWCPLENGLDAKLRPFSHALGEVMRHHETVLRSPRGVAAHILDSYVENQRHVKFVRVKFSENGHSSWLVELRNVLASAGFQCFIIDGSQMLVLGPAAHKLSRWIVAVRTVCKALSANGRAIPKVMGFPPVQR